MKSGRFQFFVCFFFFLSSWPEWWLLSCLHVGPGSRSPQPLSFQCAAAAAAKSLQSCPTLCNPRDGSPSGSSVPGILRARTLEWVAVSSSNACLHAKSLQSDSVRPHRWQPARLLCPWDSPGKNAGVGCRFLLQVPTVSFSLFLEALKESWS